MSTQQRTKLGVAYARFGKTAAKPRTPDESAGNSPNQTPKRCERKTVTIGQQILGQMTEEHTQYLSSLSASGGVRSRHTRSAAIESTNQDDNVTTPKPFNDKQDSARFGVQVKSKFFCDTIRQKQTRHEQVEKQVTQQKTTKELYPPNYQRKMNSQQSPRPNNVALRSPKICKVDESTDEDFLEFMDSYVFKLSQSKAKKTQKQDRTAEKQQAKLVRKLELYEKKFKEMQINNHVQMKKLMNRDAQMKNKIQRLEEHLSELSLELEQQRLERKRFQLLFSEFHSKMRNMKKPTPHLRYPQPQSFGIISDESFKREVMLDYEDYNEQVLGTNRSNKKPSLRKDSQIGRVKSTGKFFCTKRLIELERDFSDEDMLEY